LIAISVNSLSALPASDHLRADWSFMASLGGLPSLVRRQIPNSSTMAALHL
jgi:hypothetical protein